MENTMVLGSNAENRQFHIELSPGQTGGYAILPGDPGRVDEIAAHLEHPALLADNREFRTVAGLLEGQRVTVTSTGIGGPSAAIAAEELIRCGVHTIIRVGTCGGMQRKVRPGDLVIASAAIRAEGTSRMYLTEDYPTVADFEVTLALRNAADRLGLARHVGVIHSKDSFYGQTEPHTMPIAETLQRRWQSYLRAGCLASEMEGAALFAVGLSRGVRVGVVLAALWNQELAQAGEDITQHMSSDSSIACALEAMRALMSADAERQS